MIGLVCGVFPFTVVHTGSFSIPIHISTTDQGNDRIGVWRISIHSDNNLVY